jgi:hypothetical protein
MAQNSQQRPFGPTLAPKLFEPSALAPTARGTSGAGAALQAVPPHTKERQVRVEVSSNDRDVCTWPATAEFAWTFPYPLKNVRSARIVGGVVPVPLYTIDAPWNTFTFQTSTGSRKAVSFQPGTYTAATMASSLAGLLTAADGVNTYTTALDPITGLLTITSSGSGGFGLLFGTGDYKNTYDPGLQALKNPAFVMGFVDKDATTAGTTLTAVYPPAVGPLTRLYIYVNYDATMDMRSVLRGAGKEEPTGILYCSDTDTVVANWKSLHHDSFDFVLEPNTIIPRIRTMNITIRDEFYSIVNLNNRPVNLLFEFTVLDVQER